MFQKVISRATPFARAASTATAGRTAALPTLSQTATSSSRVTTLENGIRVVTDKTAAPQASVGVFVDAGSRYEEEGKNGVAHVTEKLFIQGSTKRNQGALAKELAGLGSTLKAFSGRETTGVTLRVFPKDVQQGVDILGDVVNNVSLDNFAKAQEQAVNAIEASEARFTDVVFDKLHHTAFRGHALANPLFGTQESVAKLSAEDVQNYKETNFTGDRLVIAASGAVDHDSLVNAVKSSFGNVAPKNSKAKFDPAALTASDIMIRHDGLPSAHVVLGYQVPSANDASFYTLQVMKILLGGFAKGPNATAGVDSAASSVRLLAEGELAESLEGFHIAYSDIGLFGSYATFGFTGQMRGLAAVIQNMVKLSYWVEPSRLLEAKNKLKREIAQTADCTDKSIQSLGKQVLLAGRPISPAEAFARIDAIDEEAVKAVATEYLQDQDHVLSALGPIYELPDYNFVRVRSFYRRF